MTGRPRCPSDVCDGGGTYESIDGNLRRCPRRCKPYTLRDAERHVMIEWEALLAELDRGAFHLRMIARYLRWKVRRAKRREVERMMRWCR